MPGRPSSTRPNFSVSGPLGRPRLDRPWPTSMLCISQRKLPAVRSCRGSRRRPPSPCMRRPP
eukprot:4257276-Pyramimonas_sp.AAC.1